MGSWNATCGVTNLPITGSDAAMFMIIRKTENSKDRSHSFYYGFDLYQPVTPLYPCEYDDYGGVEVAEDDTKAFWDFILPLVSEPDAIASVERHGALRLNNTEYRLPRDWHLWMMRRDAYEMILSMPIEHWDENYRPTEKTIGEVEQILRAKFSSLISEERAKYGGALGFGMVGYELNRLFTGREQRTPPAYQACLDKLSDAIEKLGDSEARECKLIPLIEATVEPLYPLQNLQIGFDLLRKMLAPTGAMGSQSWNDTAYHHYGSFIAKVAKKECLERRMEEAA